MHRPTHSHSFDTNIHRCFRQSCQCLSSTTILGCKMRSGCGFGSYSPFLLPCVAFGSTYLGVAESQGKRESMPTISKVYLEMQSRGVLDGFATKIGTVLSDAASKTIKLIGRKPSKRESLSLRIWPHQSAFIWI